MWSSRHEVPTSSTPVRNLFQAFKRMCRRKKQANADQIRKYLHTSEQCARFLFTEFEVSHSYFPTPIACGMILLRVD